MNAEPYEILLVEDNPADAELTLHALRRETSAIRIERARDGAEALERLFCRGAFRSRSFEHPPQLVLLDLKLPKVSGHEVLRAIKADPRTRAIPVVVLTSSNHERDLAETYQLGVNSYIQKPVDLAKFRETIRQFSRYWLGVNEPPPSSAFTRSAGGERP